MRVLLLHNRYRAEGGEERAVADIAALLRRHGHDGRAAGALERRRRRGRGRARSAGRRGSDPEEVADAVRRIRRRGRPRPQPPPAVRLARAGRRREAAGARTVLHLHNFRLFCAIGVAYRDGAPCFRCRGANTLPGLRLRCRGIARRGGGLRRRASTASSRGCSSTPTGSWC